MFSKNICYFFFVLLDLLFSPIFPRGRSKKIYTTAMAETTPSSKKSSSIVTSVTLRQNISMDLSTTIEQEIQ